MGMEVMMGGAFVVQFVLTGCDLPVKQLDFPESTVNFLSLAV